MKSKLVSFCIMIFVVCAANAQTALNPTEQTIRIPTTLPPYHPRLLVKDTAKASIQKLVTSEQWARNLYEQAKKNIDPYVIRHQTDSTWIVSRLQMYWKTKATEVFVKGPVFDHAGGDPAPVPTVRYTGARDAVSVYGAPKLEDIQPYMDDPRGLYLVNNSKPDKPMEWADPSKAGRVVESINRNIMGMAKSAAFMYWLTGEEKYAKFAFDLFDTYMTGMYYRREPIDISHSHIQTLVGLSSFEVIHEDILDDLAPAYDFLYPYIQKKAPQKLSLYADTFKKWADLIIKNGVPFNNWNLFEARFVSLVAMVLENDNAYADKKGAQYYLDGILNKNATRQWSFTTLLNKGFDPNTGIWSECPGYSINVVGDFTGFVALFDRILDFDLLSQTPVIRKSVLAAAQYLYPNGYIVGFGDTHYGLLSTGPAQQMVMNAQKHNKPADEELFTRYIKMLEELNNKAGGGSGSGSGSGGHEGGGINALLSRSTFSMNPTTPAGKLEDFVTPTFYAPNVSYFVQRNGMDSKNGLMISQAGSKGNHAHANGIAMELYGKGVALAPEMGIGTSYFQPDYAEYYSQFPAHNTVVVDGISSYPVMRSNHGFKVLGTYPAPGVKKGIFPSLTFSDLYFLEPETNADQQRMMSIIRTSDSTGYYVDVFRSRKKEGGDKRHDYFYHNLGQELTVTDKVGKPLDLKPTDKLAFADGDLFAYDYLWDKRSVRMNEDITGTYKLEVPGREDIFMNLWMKGAPGREVFVVKAPPSKAYRHNVMIPDSIANIPLNTIVVRQSGEAWTHPFAAVYEPSSSGQPKSVASVSTFTPSGSKGDFVGLIVENKTGSKQHIFSSAGKKVITQNDLAFDGTYGVVSEKDGALQYLFLGNGRRMAKGSYGITARSDSASAALSMEKEGWYFTSAQSVTLTLPSGMLSGKTSIQLSVNNNRITITGRRTTTGGKPALAFGLPAMAYTKIEW